MSTNTKFLITEDLSPHKVALLFLVTLYVANELPSRRTILALLATQLEGEPIQHDGQLVIAPSLQDLCDAIQRVHEALVNRYAIGRKETVDQMESTDSSRSNESADSVKFKLLHLMWSIDNAETLHRHIVGSFSMLSDPLQVTNLGSEIIASPRSFMGRFVQKLVVSVRLLHLDESLLLFASLREYRALSETLFASLSSMNMEPAKLTMNEPLISTSPLFATWTSISKTLFATLPPAESNDDLDLFEKLTMQLLECRDVQVTPADANDDSNTILPILLLDLDVLIDRQVQLLEKFGTPTPSDLKSIMKMMASPSHNSSTIQNNYYNQSPSCYYLQYLQNLHSGDYHGAFDSLHQYFDYMVSKGSKHFYHFALISKASLHQYFGEDDKALNSIEEAISVARENKDNATLTYILTWLFHFMKHKPTLWNDQSLYQNNNELRLLEFLIKKSQNVSLLLSAMSYRFEADTLMCSGGAMNKYLESTFKATYISVNDHPTSFVKSCELTSTMWMRIGIPYLAELYADIGYQNATISGTCSDRLGLLIRRNSIKHWRGHSEDALKGIDSLFQDVSGNIPQHRILQTRKMLMQIENDLRKGRKRFAGELMQTLNSFENLDFDTESEKKRLLAMIHASNGNSSQALSLLGHQSSSTNPQSPVMQPNLINAIKTNLLRASILNLSGAHSRAFSLVIQQLQHAKKLGFQALIVEGMSTLVSVLNNLGKNYDAFLIASEVLPAFISVGNQQQIAGIYYQLAVSCCLLLEESDSQQELPKKELFTKFLCFLSISITSYRKTLDLVLLTACFELEKRMAQARPLLAAEMRDSKPFDDFKSHSQIGLSILRKRANEESDYGYLVSTV